MQSDLATVEELLKAGADVNVRDSGLATPLMYAAYSGDTDMCLLLLDWNADLSLTDNEQMSAFDYAVGNNAYYTALFMEKWVEGYSRERMLVLQDSITALEEYRISGDSCMSVQQYDCALENLKPGLVYTKLIFGEGHPMYTAALFNLAGLHKTTGRYEEALSLFQQAAQAEKAMGREQHPDYAVALRSIALLYTDMGSYDRAFPLFRQAIEILREALGEAHPYYAVAINDLAYLHTNAGNYDKALLLFQQVLEINRKALGEDHPEYATSLNNLASLYTTIGNYEKALPLFRQALQIRREALGETHPDYATSLLNMAALYENTGSYGEALSLQQEALQIYKGVLGEDHPDYALSLNNLAGIYERMGSYDKALQLHRQALQIRRDALGEDHPDYALSLDNLAAAYERMGEYGKALPLYQQALQVRKESLGQKHPDYASSLNNLGLAFYGNKQMAKGAGFLKQGVLLTAEYLRNGSRFLSQSDMINYITENLHYFDITASIAYAYRDPSLWELGLQTELLFKGIALQNRKDLLAVIGQNKDPAMEQLIFQFRASRSFLASLYQNNAPAEETDSVLSRLDDYERQLMRQSPEYQRLVEQREVNWQQVRQQLGPEEAAVQFIRFDYWNRQWTDSVLYAAYIFRRNDSIPRFVPLFEERQLQQLIDSAGNDPTQMVGNFYRGVSVLGRGQSASLGPKLYQLVWKPLEPYLRGVKRISYTPAGKLYGIAFHALSADGSALLIDQYHLQQYSSLREIAFRNDQPGEGGPGGIALFGDPAFSMDRPAGEADALFTLTPDTRGVAASGWQDLPGTAAEVEEIQRLFEKNRINSAVFTRAEASEENLKVLSGDSPRVLHIATHGFFLPGPEKEEKDPSQGAATSVYTLAEDPLMRSGLVLSGANYAWSGKQLPGGVEDGIATAYEISQLDLGGTRLVVLSACETALGDIKGSEGVFGLQRAFKMAGAEKMIVSLWQVPDKETAELMADFYQNWIAGETIAGAFARAQANARKKYPPFYWAAFVLVE